MSEMSEMVFAAFMQYCIQSTDFMSEILYYTLYTVAPCPSRGEGYLDLFEPSTLWVYRFTTSQTEEAALLTFLDLTTTRVIAGKTHSQSPILKCYGGAQQPSNSYISTTKLHPPHPNKLPACTEF